MRGQCRVMSISPGYDDTPLQDPARQKNSIRVVAREQGATYQGMIDFVLHQAILPDISLISTFNEFHEATHIEPTAPIGDTYIRLTARFVRALKRLDKASASTR